MVTPQRSIRINEELWRKAKEKAESEGKTVSEVIVVALKNFNQEVKEEFYCSGCQPS
jgi:macrodomain Ter protein organizer (MatP/YcbG family)